MKLLSLITKKPFVAPLKESHNISPDAIKSIEDIKKLIQKKIATNRGFNSAENQGLMKAMDIIDEYLKSK
jgi:hypothetical protein